MVCPELLTWPPLPYCPGDKLPESLPRADNIALFACAPDQCAAVTSSLWQSRRGLVLHNCLGRPVARGTPLSSSDLPPIAPGHCFFLSGSWFCLLAALILKSSKFSVARRRQPRGRRWRKLTGAAMLGELCQAGRVSGGHECRSARGQSIGSRKVCKENPGRLWVKSASVL